MSVLIIYGQLMHWHNFTSDVLLPHFNGKINAIKIFTDAMKELGPLELTEEQKEKMIAVKLKKAKGKKETGEIGIDGKSRD